MRNPAPTNIDANLAAELHRSMLRIRLVEERIVTLYGEQQMRCPVHLSIGQEAAAAGACLAMRPDDYAMSGHRSHGHYIAKGGSLRAMMAEIYGKATGCAQGKGGSMHLVDLDAGFLGAAPIVGSTIPIGVGTAFTSKLRGEKRVSMVFLGDGATEAGVFHESLNFAALHKLPVVFLCENNLFSVYSPMEVRQPAGRTMADLAEGHGIATLTGDGNDVREVWRLSAEAVAQARDGLGPVFVELATYRWREHCGPNFDNDIGYRTEAEYLAWRERDPVAAHERLLLEQRQATAADIASWTVAIEAEIDDAFAFAKSSPVPDAPALMEHLYA